MTSVAVLAEPTNAFQQSLYVKWGLIPTLTSFGCGLNEYVFPDGWSISFNSDKQDLRFEQVDKTVTIMDENDSCRISYVVLAANNAVDPNTLWLACRYQVHINEIPYKDYDPCCYISNGFEPVELLTPGLVSQAEEAAVYNAAVYWLEAQRPGWQSHLF